MRRITPILFTALFLQSSGGYASSCACGPTHCTDTPAYTSSLKKKKADVASAGMPKRLVALYDRLDHCEAAITTAPDAANLFRRSKAGEIWVDGWNSENEKIGAKAVRLGDLTDCYVILSRRAFSCCGAKSFSDRPDYNTVLDLNTQTALQCSE